MAPLSTLLTSNYGRPYRTHIESFQSTWQQYSLSGLQMILRTSIYLFTFSIPAILSCFRLYRNSNFFYPYELLLMSRYYGAVEGNLEQLFPFIVLLIRPI